MLVVKHRGGGSRYGGSGIFDAISRRMLSSGFKKAISTGAQNMADAVVNRATSTTQKVVEGAVNEAINKVNVLEKKRTQEGEASYTKQSKINIASLIDDCRLER